MYTSPIAQLCKNCCDSKLKCDFCHILQYLYFPLTWQIHHNKSVQQNAVCFALFTHKSIDQLFCLTQWHANHLNLLRSRLYPRSQKQHQHQSHKRRGLQSGLQARPTNVTATINLGRARRHNWRKREKCKMRAGVMCLVDRRSHLQYFTQSMLRVDRIHYSPFQKNDIVHTYTTWHHLREQRSGRHARTVAVIRRQR